MTSPSIVSYLRKYVGRMKDREPLKYSKLYLLLRGPMELTGPQEGPHEKVGDSVKCLVCRALCLHK